MPKGMVTATPGGFLAAGYDGAGAAQQAVIWTSRDGVTWQRQTASQLGLQEPEEGPARLTRFNRPVGILVQRVVEGARYSESVHRAVAGEQRVAPTSRLRWNGRDRCLQVRLGRAADGTQW